MNHLAASEQPSATTDANIAAAASVQAFSATSISLAEAQTLRKAIPAWAPPDTPGHFFKYADEQTVVAAQAINQLIAAEEIEVSECREWGVIVAPRFIGRLAGAGIRDRFCQRGDQAVSPHTLPQHSLHSPSGALSILLGTRGPNAGMGGGPNSFTEGLLGALTMFDFGATPGVWFVATDWSPEPLPDEKGSCTTPAVCHAFCMLLRPASAATTLGHLTLRTQKTGSSIEKPVAEVRASQLIHALDIASQRDMPLGFEWQLPWGGRIEMRLETAGIAKEIAA